MNIVSATYTLIFLGSFLLFSVQPFLGKAILPFYGGASSTWLTCLFFFQFVLFIGYLYSYVITNYLNLKKQYLVHSLLTIISILQIPILITPNENNSPVFSILQTLFCILTPYLLLSTNVSTLQSWLQKSTANKSKSNSKPLNFAWIYGLSNFASFLALLSFPFLIEPYIGIKLQIKFWSGLYLIYALSVTSISILYYFKTKEESLAKEKQVAETSKTSSSAKLEFNPNWLIASFLGNAILISGTANLTQKVVSIPFLWILPLTLYLLSFVVAFSMPKANIRILWLVLFFLSALLLTSFTEKTFLNGFFTQIFANNLLVFAACMLLHGELYRLKPSDSHLSFFYFILTSGGVLACVFVGILPSIIFNDYYEFEFTLFFIVSFFLNQKLTEDGLLLNKNSINILIKTFFIILGLLLILKIRAGDKKLSMRNFYGVVKVYEEKSDDKSIRVMQNGNTIHGLEFLDQNIKNQPATYYCNTSLAGRILSNNTPVDIEQGSLNSKREIAIIGLGVGTLNYYSKTNDNLSLFEINPDVITLAKEQFSFIKNTQATYQHIVGDARKTIEKVADGKFDIIVVDAFNGDNIPVHLLTTEAFKSYFKKLRPHGVIILHISNTHLDIKKVLAPIAVSENYSAFYLIDQGNMETKCFLNEYAVFARRDSDIEGTIGAESYSVLTTLKQPSLTNSKPWTDDYSNLFKILRW